MDMIKAYNMQSVEGIPEQASFFEKDSVQDVTIRSVSSVSANQKQSDEEQEEEPAEE